MKNIITYKLFESSSFENNEISDCLIDLIDMGFKIDWRSSYGSKTLDDNILYCIILVKKDVDVDDNRNLTGHFKKGVFNPPNYHVRDLIQKPINLEEKILYYLKDAISKIENLYVPKYNFGSYEFVQNHKFSYQYIKIKFFK